jgi:centriolar protein POC1
VRDVKFHPDGTCVASGSDDGKSKLWDLRSKRLLQHYDAHDDSVTKISFHPNGKYLISASSDSTIKIWDVRMGNILFTLYGHDGPVSAINFSSCGDYFATGGEDTIVNVWKSNLDSMGQPDTLDDVTGLISIGGLKESTLKSNIETYLVPGHPDYDKSKSGKKKTFKAGPGSQGSFAARDGTYLRSENSKSDLMSSKKLQFDDMQSRAPEDEFYKQPAKIETIPETAFSNTTFENIPHEISSTVSKVVNQIDMLSNMLQLLEQRVSSNEVQAKEALTFFKDLNKRNEMRTPVKPETTDHELRTLD